MPYAAPMPCRKAGCPETVSGGGYCPGHKQAERQRQDRNRASASKRGYDRTWQKARKDFLNKHPLCECPDCQAGVKRTVPATVVDHITAHRGDQSLFWDMDNWQALAKQCHDRKTAKGQ